MKTYLINDAPTIRHQGESREPLNSSRVTSAARAELIQWIPAYAGMMIYGGN
jgi:hypothetical protein